MVLVIENNDTSIRVWTGNWPYAYGFQCSPITCNAMSGYPSKATKQKLKQFLATLQRTTLGL